MLQLALLELGSGANKQTNKQTRLQILVDPN